MQDLNVFDNFWTLELQMLRSQDQVLNMPLILGLQGYFVVD